MTTSLSRDEAENLARQHGLRRVDQASGIGEYLRECWRLRHFTSQYAVSRLIATTAQNNLGLFWEFLTPLLLSGMYYAVFGLLLGTHRDSENFVVFLIAGVFTWQMLSQTIIVVSSSLIQTKDLSGSLLFPRILIPVAVSYEALLRGSASMLLLYPIAFSTGLRPNWWWLTLPLVFLLAAGLGLGVGLFAARAIQAVRDLRQFVPLAMRGGMFMSGVFYDVDKRFAGAPEALKAIAHYNPGAIVLDVARGIFLPADAATPRQLWWLCGLTIALLVSGTLVFWLGERRNG